MRLIQQRKAQLGLDIIRSVMVLVLILGVVAIAVFTGLEAVSRGTTILPDVTLKNGSIVDNISINKMTEAPKDITGAQDFKEVKFDLTTLVITNGTGDLGYACAGGGNFNSSACTYDTNNFTVNAFQIFISDGNAVMNNTLVNITGNFTYFRGNDATLVVGNVTRGTALFFENIPTVFSILGIVMIILAVVLIFFAINRFSRKEDSI